MRTRGLFALLGVSAACAFAAQSAVAEPFHHEFPGHFGDAPPTTAQCQADFGIACYGPIQYEKAYDMNPLYRAGLTGAGKTIVIVDSFGSPTIKSDLQTFDAAYGLPGPPSFNVITPDGPVNQNDPAAPSWGVETSLDVEYSHAIAPGANILLVETPVAETEGVTGLPEIVAAENFVINHHLGDVITQSFGATEATFPSARSILGLRSAFENAAAHGVSVLASSGDAGPTDATAAPDAEDFYPFRVNSWPSSDPLVTSVGGTHLQLDASGNRLAPDSVWNDGTELFNLFGPPDTPAAGGGGVSAVFSRPFYQDRVANVTGGRRGTPDISMSAAVDGGANVFWSFPGAGEPGWNVIGGTSEASPLFSGLVAVADQAAGHDLGLLNPALYDHADRFGSGVVDVTHGNNTVTFENPAGDPFPGTHTVQGFNAVRGYDLASGLGTADGTALVAELAGHGGFKRH
ncbi:MAG TPA: S53 family peptidase [Solirubrobacteraceae bacterium]|nr:S53 family peptidase [Solirubrobacteraceae bacterium]